MGLKSNYRMLKRSEIKSRGRKRGNRSKVNKKNLRLKKRGGRSNKNTKRRMRGGSCDQGSNPICVITFGPTGAGKSRLHVSAILALQKKGILTDVNMMPGEFGVTGDFKMILIDDIIAGNGSDKKPSNAYMESILQIFDEILTDEDDVTQEVKDLFQNPTPDQLKKFSKAYFDARGVDPCEPHTSVDGINCDNHNDKLLNDAITSGKNVVIEMRGLYKPEWVYDVLKDKQGDKKYNVILAISCVHNIGALIERNKSRALATAMELINFNGGIELSTTKAEVLEKLKGMNPLPRLPDINFDHYKKQCETIHKVTKECIVSRIFGEWNPHIVLVDNQKFPNKFTNDEMGENHWMFKAGCDKYIKGDGENLGPCVVIPKLENNNNNVVDWIISHNTDTLFGVVPGDNSVLEEHYDRLELDEMVRNFKITGKVLEAVDKFKNLGRRSRARQAGEEGGN